MDDQRDYAEELANRNDSHKEYGLEYADELINSEYPGAHVVRWFQNGQIWTILALTPEADGHIIVDFRDGERIKGTGWFTASDTRAWEIFDSRR